MHTQNSTSIATSHTSSEEAASTVSCSSEDEGALGKCTTPREVSIRTATAVTQSHVLILDLDETIIRSFTTKPTCPNYGESKRITYTDSNGLQVCHIIKRPGLDELLEEVSQKYRIFIYTQSLSQYALAIVEGAGISKYISGVYSRQDCQLVSENNYQKNIFNFGFDAEKLVFVDDWEKQTQHAAENSITIRFFNGRSTDEELFTLKQFLSKLAEQDDVRSVAARYKEFKGEKQEKSSCMAGGRRGFEDMLRWAKLQECKLTTTTTTAVCRA